MRVISLLVILLFSIWGHSQDTIIEIHPIERASFYYSYEIVEVKNDSTNSYSDENVEFKFYEVWVKKQIGHLKDIRSSSFDSLYNGYWNFRNYQGNFINGKQDGEWVFFEINKTPKFLNHKFIGEVADTVIHHEFYKNGLADGQWYRFKNKIRQNTFNFIEGKLDGEIIEFFDENLIFKIEIKANYKMGVPHGSYTKKYIHITDNSDSDIIKGTFNFGIPIGKWEFIGANENTVTYWFFNDKGEILKTRMFERKGENEEVEYNTPCQFILIQNSDNTQVSQKLDITHVVSIFEVIKKWKGHCRNFKTTIFFETEKFEDSKIQAIQYGGSDEYRNGKIFLEYYSNGKLKQEGVINQYRKEYDINGKLIRSTSKFNSLWDGLH